MFPIRFLDVTIIVGVVALDKRFLHKITIYFFFTLWSIGSKIISSNHQSVRGSIVMQNLIGSKLLQSEIRNVAAKGDSSVILNSINFLIEISAK